MLLTLRHQEAVAARIPAVAFQALERNASIEYIEVDHIREPYAWSNVSARRGWRAQHRGRWE